jgi:hypothetical protein
MREKNWTPLAIWEIKTTLIFQLTLPRMIIIRKRENKYWRRSGENKTVIHCWWE